MTAPKLNASGAIVPFDFGAVVAGVVAPVFSDLQGVADQFFGIKPDPDVVTTPVPAPTYPITGTPIMGSTATSPYVPVSVVGSLVAPVKSEAESMLRQLEVDTFHKFLSYLIAAVEQQKWWKKYSNTVAAFFTGLIVLAGWATTTTLGFPHWVSIVAGVILFLGSVLGVHGTPNGLDNTVIASTLKMPFSPVAQVDNTATSPPVSSAKKSTT